MNWNNRTVVITGGATGIGKATKDLLRAKGATVYSLDIVEESDDDAAYFIYCDVRKMQSVAEAFNKVYEKEKK
jgi:NAD(P)-dependent dehydrogenase (short-subunit alcohol dehydrogenase family)